MRKLLYLILVLPGLLACCKKQSSGSDAEVVFNLSLDRSLPVNSEVTVDTKATEYIPRHFVCAYKLNSAGEVQNQEQADYTFSWTGDKSSYAGSLPVGQYRVMAWSDYQPGSVATPYWDPSDFSNIKMDRVHEGSAEYLRAYKGDVTLDVTDSGNRALSIPMVSPMGKFVLYSTEGDQVDASVLKARISYSQFMPTSFGMFHDNPVDSKSGVSFVSYPEQANDGSWVIGFDYVLTGTGEISMPIQLDILTPYNEVLTTYNLTIPIVRGKVTNVRGAFFSGSNQAAITVDSDFEGTFTIEI